MHSDSSEPSEGAALPVSRAVSTAEKRAEYVRLGLEWPKYPDGTDKIWNRNSHYTAGGRWVAWPKIVKDREAARRRHAVKRTQPGTCGTRGCSNRKHQNATGTYTPLCYEHWLERNKRIYHNGGRHRSRELQAQRLEAQIQEVLGNHPELKEFLNVKED